MDFLWVFFSSLFLILISLIFCLEDQDRLILGNVKLCTRTLNFCSLQ